MRIHTARFGAIEVHGEHIYVFPEGLVGFPKLRHVALLVDEHEPHIVWLQSLMDAQLAFAAVSPRAYVPEYRVRVSASQLAPLQYRHERPLHVLCLLSEHDHRLCINLKAPVLIDRPHALGCQVVVLDDWPMAYPLAELSVGLFRRTA